MSDLYAFLQFYIVILALGIGFWPLSKTILPRFVDKGWILSKVVGIGIVSYIVWLLAITRVLRFSPLHTILIAVLISVLIWSVQIFHSRSIKSTISAIPWKVVIISEVLFLCLFVFWSIVRAYNPDIHGLEKFMDYGFMLSILRAEYFPPVDHFFASEPINYYYFGHYVAAVITQISHLPPNFTYNLQIAYLFAISFMGSFSITATLLRNVFPHIHKIIIFIGGILGGILTALTGNLHTVLHISSLDTYWYATASRLIPFTINEFPVYSFIVADLHAHVSNIPFVLVALGILCNLFISRVNLSIGVHSLKNTRLLLSLTILALMVGTSYATNSWDFPIYLVLSGCVFVYLAYHTIAHSTRSRLLAWWEALETAALFAIPLLIGSVGLFAPFWLTVKPISDGIGKVTTLSPLKEFLILWGMYLFIAVSFVIFALRQTLARFLHTRNMKERIVQKIAGALKVSISVKNEPSDGNTPEQATRNSSDTFALLLIGLGIALLIAPEIIYVKDIYVPDYYRANTMFKLYYAAWILLSIASAYAFIRMLYTIKKESLQVLWRLDVLLSYLLIGSTLLYPYMAIKTVTDAFSEYKGLNGTAYVTKTLKHDAAAIDWINKNITGQPVIVEAVGDSYTDYARIASNTGLPTVMGWPVHEWLWRGSYAEPVEPPSRVLETFGSDTVAQRVEDVRVIYTTTDQTKRAELLRKYNVSYIYISKLERDKYPDIQTDLLLSQGTHVFEQGESILVKVQ